jgi:hypothetical protein
MGLGGFSVRKPKRAHRCVYGAARSIIKKNCAIGRLKFQLNVLAFLVRDCLTSVLGSLATRLEPIFLNSLQESVALGAAASQ